MTGKVERVERGAMEGDTGVGALARSHSALISADFLESGFQAAEKAIRRWFPPSPLHADVCSMGL